MRRVAALLALAGGAFALSIALAELVVRLVAPQNLVLIRGDVWIPHPRYSFTTAPSLDVPMSAGESRVRFRTDEAGNRIGAADRRAGAIRILALGDSFLQAVEVEYEQTFGALLEDRLTSALGRTATVVNAGVSGWSPNQYRLKIDDELAATPYDLVLIFLYLGNDIVDRRVATFEPRTPAVRHDFRAPRSLGRKEIVDAVLYPINDFLEERSHVFTLAKDNALLLRMKFGLTSIQMPPALDRRAVNAPAWGLTADIMEEMQGVAHAAGSAFAVVLLPSIHEVDTQFVDRYVSFLGLDPTQYDRDQPSRKMRRGLGRRKVEVIDATPMLRDAYGEGGPRLFDRVTIHLSPAGHRVVADGLVPGVSVLLRAL